MSLWRGSSTPIPHRGRHPTSMAHPTGTPSASPIARPGLGTWPAVPRSPQGGDGPRGRLRRQVPRRGASPRGGERTPTRRAPSGVVANAGFRAVLGYHPHATLPGRGAPCVQLSGDLRPREASAPKPNDPLTDLLGYGPPTPYSNRTSTARGECGLSLGILRICMHPRGTRRFPNASRHRGTVRSLLHVEGAR